MVRKFFCVLMMFLCWQGLAVGAASPVGTDIFTRQPALTEDEILTYCENPEIVASMDVPEKYEAGLAKLDMTSERFQYVFIKINTFVYIDQKLADAKEFKPEALPTAQEKKTLEKYRADILKATAALENLWPKNK